MGETRALLDNPDFRHDYSRCVIHAREVTKHFLCRLWVPPLEQITP